MAKHRTHSVEFKWQVVEEYLGGETLHGLSKRHDISRNLIRIWVESIRRVRSTRISRRLISSRFMKRHENRLANSIPRGRLTWLMSDAVQVIRASSVERSKRAYRIVDNNLPASARRLLQVMLISQRFARFRAWSYPRSAPPDRRDSFGANVRPP